MWAACRTSNPVVVAKASTRATPSKPNTVDMLGRIAGRMASSVRARLPTSMPTIYTPARAAFVAGAVFASPMVEGEEFFQHSFVTDKKVDDIQDFYSTEDFLQILGVFPLAISFVLSGVEWDLERENTMAVHNAMEISFTLEENEDTGFFQKRERFKNYIPFTKILLWDQVQCYGHRMREDGKMEVFHKGEYINGPLPVRMLVKLHAMYVIWAVEKHINSPVFGNGDFEANEHQRSNVPVYVMNEFVRRITLAYEIAKESGSIAASTKPEEAEATLKKLRKLRQSPESQYVATLRKNNLKRQMSIGFDDPDAQSVIDSAVATLAKSQQGREAAKEAMKAVSLHPEVVTARPRYGGAFGLKVLKGTKTNMEMES